MATPLTDAINALTTYANSVTGESDTNLSDAVYSLAEGYGQGDEPTGPTYVNVIPEQTFTPTADYTAVTFTELLVADEKYRYIVNGVEKTGTAADFYGSIVLGSYSDYNSGTGGAFECVNGTVYYDTKLRTSHTVQVDRVVEGSGGGSSSSNPLKGKIAAFTGDSLCAGAGYTGGYAGIIGTDYEMTVQNIGTSEGTIVRYQSYFCISESIANLRSDADFVLLEGGGNDAWYGTQVIPLGTLSSGYSATLDTTTFAGAFENMLKSAIARFPNAKIGYIFPHKCIANFDSPNGAYRNMAISALEKWGIPYCDLNISVPPLGYIDDLKTTYTAGDGIHPNEAGYRTFYVPKIVAFMQTMLTDKTLINKTVTANGTYLATDDDADGYSSVTVNVPSGGASSWTKIAETSYQVSTTNTAVQNVATWETGSSDLWTSSKWVYVRIRDTAGKREGYFYGCDQFFCNKEPINGTSSTYTDAAMNLYIRYSASGFGAGINTIVSFYGVYADRLYSNGDLRIRSRYHSSNTLTIDGTYKVEVYLLDPAGGVPIFE